jgi:hypothetical protein
MTVPAHSRTRAAALALAAGAMLVAPAAADAKHKPPKPPHHGAVRGESSCSILTPGVAPGVITTVGHYTIGRRGNGTLVCHGRVPQGPPHRIVIDGLRCPTPAGVTWKSHTVITPSGAVTLTCHFKARKGRRHHPESPR